MKQKVVVTGGAGFIGSSLVRELIKKGYDVHVVDNYSGGRFPERLSEETVYHDGDIRDVELLNKVFADAVYVFHLAALPRVQYSIENPLETHSVNVDGTIAVLDAARKSGVKRVIFSSSSAVYGDQEHMPIVESMEAHPKSPYALHKLIGEQYCKLYRELYDIETVSLRYFNVYGPHADPEGAYALVIAKFIKQRLEGKPLTIVGTGTNTRDYTHVYDVVRANILAAESDTVGNAEIFNIGSGKNFSVNEVAELIGGPTVIVEARIEPKDTIADVSRAQKGLGWGPEVTFEEGIAELKKDAQLS